MPESGSAKTSSGPSSGSGSSAGSIQVDCCEQPVGKTLTATLENVSGCSNIDGITVELNWQFGATWTGAETCNGEAIGITLQCVGSAWGMSDFGLCGTTGTPDKISESCDPFELIFEANFFIGLTNCDCCNGDPVIKITVTD